MKERLVAHFNREVASQVNGTLEDVVIEDLECSYRGRSRHYAVTYLYKNEKGSEGKKSLNLRGIAFNTDELDRWIYPGATVDAYTEFVYRSLERLCCEVGFTSPLVKFYGRIPELRLFLIENLEWPTATDEINNLFLDFMDCLRKISGRKILLPSSYYESELMEAKNKFLDRRNRLIQACLNALNMINVFPAEMVRGIKMTLPVLVSRDGADVIEEKEISFFERSADFYVKSLEILLPYTFVALGRNYPKFLEAIEKARLSGKLKEGGKEFDVDPYDFIPKEMLDKKKDFLNSYRELMEYVSSGHLTLVHGDAHPGNFLVRRKGDDYEVKIIDVKRVSISAHEIDKGDFLSWFQMRMWEIESRFKGHKEFEDIIQSMRLLRIL